MVITTALIVACKVIVLGAHGALALAYALGATRRRNIPEPWRLTPSEEARVMVLYVIWVALLAVAVLG